MTMKTNGDMPAMPNQALGTHCLPTHEPEFGLTKREMMAMHMMSGILCGCVSSGIARDSKDAENIAKAATLASDALLAELERTK